MIHLATQADGPGVPLRQREDGGAPAPFTAPHSDAAHAAGGVASGSKGDIGHSKALDAAVAAAIAAAMRDAEG